MADHPGAATMPYAIAAIAEEGSLRVRFPGACAGAQEAVLVNTAGGIAGGDRLRIAMTLDDGARLVVTTAAAEKAYRTDGPQASVAVTATLGADAELTWLPRETILFDRARLARRVEVAMAPTARLLFAETVIFGRAAMGEAVRYGHFSDHWRVRRDGRLVFADQVRLDGAIADRFPLAETAGLAAGRVALAHRAARRTGCERCGGRGRARTSPTCDLRGEVSASPQLERPCAGTARGRRRRRAASRCRPVVIRTRPRAPAPAVAELAMPMMDAFVDSAD